MIRNVTRNTIVARSFVTCSTFWEQTRGLMFRKKVIPLLFVFPKEQRFRLHSWFCPGPIDLIFLDASWEVVELKSEWKRYGSYSSLRDAMFLLELPAGSIAQSRTEVGDILNIKR
ncbi:DUF192 domain-containing protein [Candidatus Woesearchaeota archaeon]|nr:MAG: DUF192 domain-containing protein [Candidatus Woesearchaeota archaeon]